MALAPFKLASITVEMKLAVPAASLRALVSLTTVGKLEARISKAGPPQAG